jgi:hypothetical protein
LELLASEERQLEYERNVPHVDVTAELICMWFNDHIYDPQEVEADASFSDTERVVLAQFHQLYDNRVNQLPDSQGTVRTWLASPTWREVMQGARSTLDRVAA